MVSGRNQCAYCKRSIASGQRWVREKIYDSALNGRDPSYHRYHAEPCAGENLSCWEKSLLAKDLARANVYAA
jgi:hypothetical protein